MSAADTIGAPPPQPEGFMPDVERERAAHDDPPDPADIPLGQRLFDRMFLLLVLGIVIMIAVYTGWGLWEIATMPTGTLP
jgi:hypothetical protein